MKCGKCEKKLDRVKDVIVYIRIEYPQGPTFGKVWCLDCYTEGRDI